MTPLCRWWNWDVFKRFSVISFHLAHTGFQAKHSLTIKSLNQQCSLIKIDFDIFLCKCSINYWEIWHAHKSIDTVLAQAFWNENKHYMQSTYRCHVIAVLSSEKSMSFSLNYQLKYSEVYNYSLVKLNSLSNIYFWENSYTLAQERRFYGRLHQNECI